ncbi:MAG: hypothetical protein AMS25_00695 [Gemmatimonas sp. SM23_52]|nr:MAG: hypothetical protein AMS25_00695 [Gemmatimonas sp. SM23_52]
MNANDREAGRLLELHEAHVRAWKEFDLGALGQIYDPDCYVFDTIPPPVFRNLREFLEHLTPVLQSYSRFKLRTFDQLVRVDERRDDRIGWVASRYELEAGRDEGIYRHTGRWTEIFEKRDDTWRLVHFHSSKDPAEL